MAYKITYYPTRAGGDPITISADDTPFQLEQQIFTLDGYVITEWALNSPTGKTFKPGELITDKKVSELIDAKLYAVWHISNYGQIIVRNTDENGVITDTDISDIYAGIYSVSGKNQPFSYITFSLIKNLFNDETAGGYWAKRKAVEPGISKPPLIQKETKIIVNVFGMAGEWLYEKTDDDDNTIWKITAVTSAYSLKSTTLESLLAFSVSGMNATFYKIGTTVQLVPVTVSDITRYIAVLPITYIRSNMSETTEYITLTIELLYDAETGALYSSTVEKICGTGSAIFAFIVKYCADYTGVLASEDRRIFVDPGFLYDFTARSKYSTVQDTYEQGQIRDAKYIKLPLYQEGWYDAQNLELRPDEYCWTIIQGIGYLTNRYAFFEKDAYFGDYQTYHSSEGDSEIIQHYFEDKTHYTTDELHINWAGDNLIHDGYLTPEIVGLSTNDDQGSQYILQSQTVISESYETTVSISNSKSTESGDDIKYMYREDVETTGTTDDPFKFNTDIRNFQTKVIAFNQLVKWYKPGDCVSYNIHEGQRNYTYSVKSYAELTDGQHPPAEGYTALVSNPQIFEDYVYEAEKSGSTYVWPPEKEGIITTGDSPVRRPSYAIYSVAAELKDEQNGLTLTDVPLSQIVVTYPACVVSYTWGEPYFMDDESQISDIDSITSDTTLDNTGATQISDNFAAKIVVGNQSLSELTDDRDNFTGLILEKNWDIDLYRLAGYKNGKIQAQFNTEGKITAGGGNVVIDDSGVRTYHSYDTERSKWVAWMDTDGSFLSGNLSGGNGKEHAVSINDTGLTLIFKADSYTTPSSIDFKKYQDTQDQALVRLYALNKSYGDYLQLMYFDSISDTPIILKTISDRGSETITYKFMSDTEKALISTQQFSLLENNVTNYLEGTSFQGFAGGGTCIFRRMTNPTPWKEAQSPSQTVIGSTDGDIPMPSGIIKFHIRLKINRDAGMANSMYLTVSILDTYGGVLASREISSTGQYTEDCVFDITGCTAIKGIKINTKTDHDSYTRGWFIVSDLWIEVISATNGSEVILDPLSQYSYAGEETYLQLNASTRIGKDYANQHHVHGKMYFHDGYEVDGDINLSDEALTALAEKLKPKLGL